MARDDHLAGRRVNLYFRSDGDCLITQRRRVRLDTARSPPAKAYRRPADGRCGRGGDAGLARER